MQPESRKLLARGITKTSLGSVDAEHWRGLLQQLRSNSSAIAELKQKAEHRQLAQAEMQKLALSFITAEKPVEELRTYFQAKTGSDWKTFGFNGFSGAMILNMLVKHVQDKPTLTSKLRIVLKAPIGSGDAQEQLQNYLAYLTDLTKNGQLTLRTASVDRVPFFVSAWWHVQQPELWPIFYPTTRQVFTQGKLYEPTGEPITDYLNFCQIHQAIASTLEIDSLELEFLCSWLEKEAGSTKPILQPELQVNENDSQSEFSEGLHTKVQWLLAKLGHKLSCRVWIPPGDRSKSYQNESLKELSINELPQLGVADNVTRIIGNIDVLWLTGRNQIEAAFEIECTTSVYSGLLRMSDLTVADPNHSFPLFIVVPEKRLPKVISELSRPTFQHLELNQRCWYFSIEDLVKQHEHISSWATDPAAIKKLAHKVDNMPD